jgi:hypothetical protein
LTTRLPAWAAVFAGTALAAAASMGVAIAAYQAGGLEEALSPLRARAFMVVEDMLRAQDLTDRVDAQQLSGALARAFPAIVAAYALLLHMLNLWLAGRLAKASGLLTRDWPDVATQFVLPRAVAASFAIGAVCSFIGGILGEVALIVAATAGLALALQGLAVTHVLVRGVKSGGVVLAIVYFMLGLFGWPIVFFTALGLADAAFSFRARKAAEGRG